MFEPPRRIGGSDAAGEIDYELSAQFVASDGVHAARTIVARLHVPAPRAGELEHHYGVHAPVACHCYLVQPPCNPDMTTIQLELDAPAYARVDR